MTPGLELSKSILKNGVRPSLGELSGIYVARGDFSKVWEEKETRLSLEGKMGYKKGFSLKGNTLSNSERER